MLTFDKTIARLDIDSNKWTKLGNLQHGRHDFGAIEVEKKFLVMGGEGKKISEICQWVGEEIECKEREPIFDNFYIPATMTIFPDYVKNC